MPSIGRTRILTHILVTLVLLATVKADDPGHLFPAFSYGKYGYINASGSLVIAPQFVGASEFSEGFACVYMPQGGAHSATFINRKGESLLPPQLSACREFSEGRGAIGIDTVLSPSNGQVWSFRNGLAKVDEYGGYIDRTGKTVWPQ